MSAAAAHTPLPAATAAPDVAPRDPLVSLDSRCVVSPYKRRPRAAGCWRQAISGVAGWCCAGTWAAGDLPLVASSPTSARSSTARRVIWDAQHIVKYPHQQTCFTEGLFINSTSGEVIESCGLYRQSYLRAYGLAAGDTRRTGLVPREYFAEGVVALGDALYLLTYHAAKVLEYHPHTLERRSREHPFPYGQGWGLTTDGCDLLATTGSSFLYRLRPNSEGVLQLVTKVEVKNGAVPIRKLNELEYITPKVWVNEWHANRLWRVDPVTGIAEVFIDIGTLQTWHGEDTPNGIAYSAAHLGENKMLVTGKRWPHMYELLFDMESLCGDTVASPSCDAAPPSACWHPPGAMVRAPAADPSTTPASSVPGASAVVTLPAQAPSLGSFSGSSSSSSSGMGSSSGSHSSTSSSQAGGALHEQFESKAAVAPETSGPAPSVSPKKVGIVLLALFGSAAMVFIPLRVCRARQRKNYVPVVSQDRDMPVPTVPGHIDPEL